MLILEFTLFCNEMLSCAQMWWFIFEEWPDVWVGFLAGDVCGIVAVSCHTPRIWVFSPKDSKDEACERGRANRIVSNLMCCWHLMKWSIWTRLFWKLSNGSAWYIYYYFMKQTFTSPFLDYCNKKNYFLLGGKAAGPIILFSCVVPSPCR
jgi:hypothetical protein